jgi:DNA-binding NarL/FixJ family response regulator
MIKLLLADDHPLMRDALRRHLETQPDLKVIAEASDGEEAVGLTLDLEPDMVIIDIAMPKLNGLEAAAEIKKQCPNVSVLILTVHADCEYVLKALEVRVNGYLTKSILGEEILHAVRLIIAGQFVLSDAAIDQLAKNTLRHSAKPLITLAHEGFSIREIEILRLTARGLSNKEVADELFLSQRTIKSYLVSIFRKLQVSSRTEAVVSCLRSGLLTLDDLG